MFPIFNQPSLGRALSSSDICEFEWPKNKYQTCAKVNTGIEVLVEQGKGSVSWVPFWCYVLFLSSLQDTFHFNCSSQPIENSISGDCKTNAIGSFDVEVDMSGPRVRTEYEENVNITYDFKAVSKLLWLHYLLLSLHITWDYIYM